MRLFLIVVLALLQPACESCEFSFGTLDSRGQLTVTGMPPTDLSIAASV
jgi:hypothetical protein